MNISKEHLKEIKMKIFKKEVTEEEKKEIIEKINIEIEDLLSKINKESEPIDE